MSRNPTPPIFFFNDTATTEIYTLSLHDALPISNVAFAAYQHAFDLGAISLVDQHDRSEEHTSELQSHSDLVCRLLLEKKHPALPGRDRRRSRASLCEARRVSDRPRRTPTPWRRH